MAKFNVDDKLEMRSPHTGDVQVVDYRGSLSPGQATVWTGRMMITVPMEWLSLPLKQYVILHHVKDDFEKYVIETTEELPDIFWAKGHEVDGWLGEERAVRVIAQAGILFDWEWDRLTILQIPKGESNAEK